MLLAACALLSTGCTYLMRQNAVQQETKNERKIPPPLHVGAVHQVYRDQNFALLRIIGPMPRAGSTLISHPADGSTSRIGNLVIPDHATSRNGMLVADIRSGVVMSGDRVFLYRNIAPPEPAKDDELDQVHVENTNASEAPVVRVRASGGESPFTEQLPAEDRPSSAEGVEVTEDTAPPASVPTNAPMMLPSVPSLPEAAPQYLNDIPNDIKEWE